MKKVFISDLRAGDVVDEVFVLAEKHMAQKRDGENFLNIMLADRSGRIKGVVWDRVETISATTESGDFVRTQGSVSEYKGLLQIVVKAMARCAADSVEPSDFLPATSRDVTKMFARLVEVSATLQDPHLKKLFELFWADAEFTKAFMTAPAAKGMHHAYLGGLLEHTLSMTLLADAVAGHYSGIDRDMLIAGALLHDCGKIKEFEFASKIDYSNAGRLVSHIVIAVEMLNEKIRQIDGFPTETALLLKHMIISHHGSRDFGSPELPKTIEAVLLHYIDEIDSKVNGIRDFMASEDPGESWTSYHRLLERHFYKGSSKLKAEG